MADHVLLRDFVERRSEEAFAELVRRHLNLVYSAALRILGEGWLVEDVAQIVFLDLARKAKMLRPDVVLAGWLYRSACFAALNVRRGERRRQKRELEALDTAQTCSEDQSVWEDSACFLEDSVKQLAQPDQEAVRLRFFEGRSLREVGQMLGLTEEAAEKRVTRALNKLRLIFAHRGLRWDTNSGRFL